MKVKLISVTRPELEEIKDFSLEELMVYIARVSNPSNQMNTMTSDKLIKYCINHGHWSVFEHIYLTYEIETSSVVAKQILRHRSFVFQEFSQRYSEANIGIEPINLRLQDTKNRQNSIETEQDQDVLNLIYNNLDNSKRLYNKLLESGYAKEVSRMILPGIVTTRLYMTGNVRSWLHYLNVRTDKSTQMEHRDVAEEIHNDFSKRLPITTEAFKTKNEQFFDRLIKTLNPQSEQEKQNIKDIVDKFWKD